ncbi:hypothetical protein Cni_G18251 [Canna indica]|uniref:Uncharacterized protein n=1 Tax=Canna indica TaxID=4628 RepID=A0AAQ3KII8_9LILI|nr:hypothetical protein Cni_G18251 [Canna indica]
MGKESDSLLYLKTSADCTIFCSFGRVGMVKGKILGKKLDLLRLRASVVMIRSYSKRRFSEFSGWTDANLRLMVMNYWNYDNAIDFWLLVVPLFSLDSKRTKEVRRAISVFCNKKKMKEGKEQMHL